MLRKLNWIFSPQLLLALCNVSGIVNLGNIEISTLFCYTISATITNLTDLQNSFAANVWAKNIDKSLVPCF